MELAPILRQLLALKAIDSTIGNRYANHIHSVVVKKEQRSVCTEKLTWVEENGTRVLRKMYADVMKTFYIPDLQASSLIRKEIQEACTTVITELVRAQTLWTLAIIQELWSTIKPVSLWLGEACALLDRDKRDDLLAIDEILLHEFSKQLVYPFIETILNQGGNTLPQWIRFLNEPFFHWNGRFTNEVQPHLMPVLEDLLTTLRNSTNIEETYREYSYWKDICSIMRSDTMRGAIMDRVLENIWDATFQVTFCATLSAYPAIDTSKKRAVFALLETAPIRTRTFLTKFLEDVLLKDLGGQGGQDVEQIVRNHSIYNNDSHITVIRDSIRGAYTTLFTDTKHVEEYAVFFDKTLRDSKMGCFDKSILVSGALLLLAYIKEKDVFIHLYQRKMALRLLSSSYSEDSEGNEGLELLIIDYLKVHVGFGTIHRLETMYKDCMKPALSIGLYKLRALNHASWSSDSLLSIPDWKIPPVLAPILESLKVTVPSSKKLTWLPAHDTLTLQTSFSGKPYTLVMTSIQASVLLLFDDGVQLSEADIQEKTGIPSYAIKSILHSIVSSRVPLLDVAKGVYTLVEKPRTSLLCIKLPRPQVVQPPERHVIADVYVEREYSADSAIVRIMKTRKRVMFSEIQMEVVKQLSHLFVPDVPLIKRRIESLIDRDYLERDSNDSSYLVYLA